MGMRPFTDRRVRSHSPHPSWSFPLVASLGTAPSAAIASSVRPSWRQGDQTYGVPNGGSSNTAAIARCASSEGNVRSTS